MLTTVCNPDDDVITLKVLREMADGGYTPQNFDLHYMENPLSSLITKWVAAGGFVWELIEPVDGFHPNQNAQASVYMLAHLYTYTHTHARTHIIIYLCVCV